MGFGGQRNPHLLTVQDVFITLSAGCADQGGDIGASSGFGQPETGDFLTPGLGDQKALLLFFSAPLEQSQAVQTDVHR